MKILKMAAKNLKLQEIVSIILAIIILTLALLIGRSISASAQTSDLKDLEPLYSFTVATWQETSFLGIPFLIEAEKSDIPQKFQLKVKNENNRYLEITSEGSLNDSTVWITWPKNIKLPAQTKFTLELHLSGPDLIGIKSVALIADYAFDWNGDEPKNPPI